MSFAMLFFILTAAISLLPMTHPALPAGPSTAVLIGIKVLALLVQARAAKAGEMEFCGAMDPAGDGKLPGSCFTIR